MAVARKKIYTPEEYLRLEERSEIRHEFVNGEIYDMAGGTTEHNLIAGNVYMAIRHGIGKKPCQAFITDVLVRIKKANLYTYPDVMLVCGKIEYDVGRKDVILNPVVLIEVLSESTGNYDHTTKFAAYRQIPSLEEYVMIGQARVSVEIFRRDKTKFWIFEALEELNDTLKLKSVGIEVSVTAIYEGVEAEE